jgi:hypothetical protein
MERHCRPFTLHVLAWDRAVFDWCARAPQVKPMPLEHMLGLRPSFRLENLPGPPRSKQEHLSALRVAHLAYLVEAIGEPVTMLDTDTMFWNSPEPVFEEIGAAPAAVTSHWFRPAADGLVGPTIESHRQYGLYNAGFVHIAAERIAKVWAEACWEWCYLGDPQPRGMNRWRFGDQGYLDEFPEIGAHVIENPGVNLGPWAVHHRELEVRDGKVFFGDRPLVLYHYHSYRAGQLADQDYQISAEQVELLYLPYQRALLMHS